MEDSEFVAAGLSVEASTQCAGRDLNPEPVDSEEIFDCILMLRSSRIAYVSLETLLSPVGLVSWWCGNMMPTMRPIRTQQLTM